MAAHQAPLSLGFSKQEHWSGLPFPSSKLCLKGKLFLPATKWNNSWMGKAIYGSGHLWSDRRILIYQVVLMENPGLTISPYEVLNPATLLPTPKGSFPFHSYLETSDHWTKPWETVRRSSDWSWGNLVHWWKQLCLGWEKKSWICSSLQFWDHRG